MLSNLEIARLQRRALAITRTAEPFATSLDMATRTRVGLLNGVGITGDRYTITVSTADLVPGLPWPHGITPNAISLFSRRQNDPRIFKNLSTPFRPGQRENFRVLESLGLVVAAARYEDANADQAARLEEPELFNHRTRGQVSEFEKIIIVGDGAAWRARRIEGPKFPAQPLRQLQPGNANIAEVLRRAPQATEADIDFLRSIIETFERQLIINS